MVSVEFTEEEARLTEAAASYLASKVRGADWHILTEASNKIKAARAEPEPEKPKRGRPRKQAE